MSRAGGVLALGFAIALSACGGGGHIRSSALAKKMGRYGNNCQRDKTLTGDALRCHPGSDGTGKTGTIFVYAGKSKSDMDVANLNPCFDTTNVPQRWVLGKDWQINVVLPEQEAPAALLDIATSTGGRLDQYRCDNPK